jgi:hypothetical protein
MFDSEYANNLPLLISKVHTTEHSSHMTEIAGGRLKNVNPTLSDD